MTAFPPTPTQIDPCSNIGIGPFWFGTQEIGTQIWNNNPVGIKIVGIHLKWPVENGNLIKVKLADNVLWSGIALPPEYWITALSGNREIPPLGSKGLSAYFNLIARFDGYLVEVHFDNDCIISRSN